MLEIGTGAGYGIEVAAPRARRFVTVDKHAPAPEPLDRPNVEFRQAVVPPLTSPDRSFDCVISFQVIEHIKRDAEFVREIHRVLRPGGRFIVTTLNAPMSLTRNPWHVREYTAEQLRRLLAARFSEIETLGASATKGDGLTMRKTAAASNASRASTFSTSSTACRAGCCKLYDILNRMNRRKLSGKTPS
ncbi:MAG: class I SAM-dependent methyltransferase [Alistipes finegoldii]